MEERVAALRRLIADYRERLRAGVTAAEAQQLLRLIMELEDELRRLLGNISG
jgi:hypothetical protein